MVDEPIFGLSPNHTVEIRKDRGATGFQSQPQRLVLFGLSKESVEKRFSRIENELKALECYGKDSILHQMVVAAFAANPSLECYAYVMGVEADGAPRETHIDFEQIPHDQFTQFVLPFYDQNIINSFVVELDKRWSTNEQIDGHLFIADDSNADQLKLRYDNDSDILCNSQHLTVIDTMGSQKPTWVWASVLGAINARHATTPSRPYAQLELPIVNNFSDDSDSRLVKSRERPERDDLLNSGISTIKIIGGRVFIDRLVTTYNKDNATNTPDKSFRDLNSKQTLSAIRYDWLTYVNKLFHRFVLSQDENQTGEFVATPKSLLGLAVSRHELWLEKLLVQDPDDSFIKRVKIEISNDGEHFKSYLPIHLMGQLRGTHTVLSFKRGKT